MTLQRFMVNMPYLGERDIIWPQFMVHLLLKVSGPQELDPVRADGTIHYGTGQAAIEALPSTTESRVS